MSKRLAILAATSPLAFLALPTAAQVDDRYEFVEPVIETYSEEVVQDITGLEDDPRDAGADYARDGHEYHDGPEYDDAGYDDRPRHHGRRGHHGRGHRAPAAPATPVLAYSAAERAEWLSQCRALHASQDEPLYYYEDAREDGDGGLIGGLVGAVAGGFIGNRVADSHRLTGTLVGAGIGGLAGAVIGSVIDNADDDDDRRLAAAPPQEPGFDYCEAYLLNYERGYGTPGQVTYAPVMMVPVAQGQMSGHDGHRGARRMIVEEVEIEADEPAPRHTARRVIHRREEQGDKRTPID